jgi:hypothetical protein
VGIRSLSDLSRWLSDLELKPNNLLIRSRIRVNGRTWFRVAIAFVAVCSAKHLAGQSRVENNLPRLPFLYLLCLQFLYLLCLQWVTLSRSKSLRWSSVVFPFAHGKTSNHPGASFTRLNLQCSSELRNSFLHPSETNACLAHRWNTRLRPSCDAFSCVFDTQPQHLAFAAYRHAGCGAARMTINVRQRLLHYSKDRNLQLT